MIVDYIKNIDFYKEFDKLYQKLKIIEDIKDKKLVFDGNKIDINENDYYKLETFITKSLLDGVFESHKKYADIHYIFEGEEVIGYDNLDNLKVKLEYDLEKDITFYYGYLRNSITLKKGMFMFLPVGDAHMPNVFLSKASLVKKMITKFVL
jgi:YhcH/YjgK/YiaL family protein